MNRLGGGERRISSIAGETVSINIYGAEAVEQQEAVNYKQMKKLCHLKKCKKRRKTKGRYCLGTSSPQTVKMCFEQLKK